MKYIFARVQRAKIFLGRLISVTTLEVLNSRRLIPSVTGRLSCGRIIVREIMKYISRFKREKINPATRRISVTTLEVLNSRRLIPSVTERL